MPSKRPNRSAIPDTEPLLESQAYEVSAFGSLDETVAATYFASVSPALDASRLVVFNTVTGAHVAEYTTPAGSLCLHVAFGKMKEQLWVSLALSTGNILIFSVSTGTLLTTLTNGHRSPVTGFVFNSSGKKGFSIGEDGLIVEWDLKKGQLLRTCQSKSKNLSKIAIDPTGSYLAVAANQIEIINISLMKNLNTFSGHATAVVQLSFDSKSKTLFSAARDDRFISQWTMESKTDTPKVYTVDSPVQFLEYSDNGYLLAQLDSGVVNVWLTDKKLGATGSASITSPPSKKRPQATCEADSIISLTNPTSSTHAQVMIHNAAFQLDRVMIVYGTSLRPLFETITFVTDAGKVIPTISLARNPDPPFAKNAVKSTTTKSGASVSVLGALDMLPATSSAKSKHIAPLNTEDATTILEERVRAMDATLEGKSAITPSSATAPSTPHNQRKHATPITVHQMLSQAIQSGDVQLLEKALEIQDKKMIMATVKRLSPAQVIALLELVVVRLQRRPARAVLLIEWVRSVLILHSAYLLSVPNASMRLGTLYRTLDTRYQALERLNKLHGRLDLAVSQIDSRRAQPTDQDADAVVVYEDNEDDASENDEEDEDEEEEFDDDEALESGEENDELESDVENNDDDGIQGMELDEGDSDED